MFFNFSFLVMSLAYKHKIYLS